MAYRILIAEDDVSISDLIEMTLELNKYEVTCVSDGKQAMEAINTREFDLALLDIMLQHHDGYALLEVLKKKNVPAIFISAKSTLKDKVYGLQLGAEDYITKPFEPLELMARVDTAIRRVKPHSDSFTIRNITINTVSHAVLKDNTPVPMTHLEYSLLELFIKNPNKMFSRDQLLNEIWGYDYLGSTRTVDVHITKLRSKLDLSDVIRTVHKSGYKLEGDVL